MISTATIDLRNGTLQGRTVFAYDSENHKIASKDANNKAMKWEYGNGRMKASFDMENKRTDYGYDQAGRLLSQISERGQKLYYTFTGANLTRIEDAATKLTTNYAYDANGNRVREQQVYLGSEQDAPPQLQNNTLRYDAQNRLVGIRDDKMDLTYAYDVNGNRVKIVSRYDNGEPITRFNAFDVMNRQTIVNGGWEVDAQGRGKAVRGNGHEITYDRSGNRLSDTYSGTRVTNNGAFGYDTLKNVDTTETYRYDAAGRLSTISRDGLLIDERHYDAGSRISQSGLAAKGARGVADVLTALGIDVAQRVYTYDAFGHMTRQKNLNASLDTISDTWFGDYDDMGNLTGYDTVPVKGDKGMYRIEYSYRDSYKELKTTLSKDNSEVTSEYDVNGNRIKIFDSKTGTLRNRLWYDAEGHVQAYLPASKTPAEPTPHFNLIVNGNVLGEENGSTDNILGSTYMPVTSSSLAAAPSSYTVQSANETLQSIAQAIWGDAKLWYLIADANALTAESKLEVGAILRIPSRVNTVHGDYGTYKPYDPSEQIGSTAPVMPPPSNKKGCGGLGQIVMIVVAVVATIYTAGAASTLMAGGTFTSFGATMSAGIGAMGSSIGAAAIGGAVGSIASQAVGIAIGAQDGFNWKGVALSAIGAGATAGVGAAFGPAGSTLGAMGRAALGNIASQAVGVATGLQKHFDWRNVAASAAGGGAGYAASEALAGLKLDGLFARTATNLAAGIASAAVRGGKIEFARIAVDAFGNALGQSIVAWSLPKAEQYDYSLGPKTEHGMGMRSTGGGFSLGDVRTGNGPVNDNWDLGDGPTAKAQNAATGSSESSNAQMPQVEAGPTYLGGIGQSDTSPDRQTTTTFADGTMVPVVLRTTNRMWAMAQMQQEESRQAAVHEPAEILRQALDQAGAPKGTVYTGDNLWTTLGLIEATKKRNDVDDLTKAQLTSAWRAVYQRGHTEQVLGMPSTVRNFPTQHKEDALGANGGTYVRMPRLATNYSLPSTKTTTYSYKGTALSDQYWIDRRPPEFATPGVRKIDQLKPSSSGGVYRQTLHYDEYGREVARTDRTNHGYWNPEHRGYHTDPHHHRINPISKQELRDPTTGKKNWPGEYEN